MKLKLRPRTYKVGVGLFLAFVALIVGAAALCAIVFVPYVIETWGTWMGYHPVIEWWKGVLIYLALGLFTRVASIYTVSAAALITGLFELCGFAGF